MSLDGMLRIFASGRSESKMRLDRKSVQKEFHQGKDDQDVNIGEVENKKIHLDIATIFKY